MIDSRLRQPIQPIFDLLGKGLASLKFTPNTVTVLALIVGIGSAIAIGLGHPILSIGLLWLSGLLDVLDGTLARITGQPSPLGAYLDLIFDRLVEGAMILGFYAWMPSLIWGLLIFQAGAMFNFTTFMLAGTLFKNEGKKSMHYDIGLVERTETFLLFTLLILLPKLAFLLLMIFNALMILTGTLRFIRVIRYQRLERGPS